MGYKAENKLLTAAVNRLEGRLKSSKTYRGFTLFEGNDTASRKAANEKKRKRSRQVAEAVKRWRQRHREEYNAQMKAYQARRKVLASVLVSQIA